jgi:maltose-binding protein MalE
MTNQIKDAGSLKPGDTGGVMHKPIVHCLLFALLLLLFSGCGGGEPGTTLIKLWEQMDPQERDVQLEHIRAIEAETPGLRIEISHYDTEQLRSQYQTAALAGAGPDLVYGPSDQVGPFSVMGLIHPIEEILPAEQLALFRAEAFDTLDTHIYALPDQLGNHLTLVWNRDLIEQAPTTMEALVELAKEMTVDEDGDGIPERYGLVFEVMEPFWTIPFLTGFGGWVMDRQNHPTLDTPAMVRALTFFKDLKFTHGVMPTECGYELADTMFKEGRAAMIINGPWSWEAYRKAGLEIGLARIPFIEETGLWPRPMVSSKGYSVNRNLEGERLHQVLELLDRLTAVENQVDFARKVGTLPTRIAAYEDTSVSGNPILLASFSQVEVGIRMPVVPEMRAIWDVMRPAVQSVWNGSLEPEEAAKQMQEQAVQKIDEMKR